MNKQATLFGGAMIIAGTIIGAGMLANPTATSGIWFSGSLIVLIYTWFSMLISGLMILEVNTHYSHGANLNTMVKDLLGHSWNMLNGLSVIFVLYLLTYAYITSGGMLTAQAITNIHIGHAPLPIFIGQLLFFFIFATCVWLSARWVDRFSGILIGGMVISFFWSVGGLLGSVKLPILLDSNTSDHTHYWIYIGTALPVCLASFGFHGNVSSLLKYFHGNAKKVAYAIIYGSLIALIIYIAWQLAIQGNLPRSQFKPVIQADGNVAVLIDQLSQFVPTNGIKQMLSFFSYMAIASSFLGVTLGLFDYLADLFKFDDNFIGRTKTATITFLPPLIGSLFAPMGFIHAINYVGLAATIWAAIVPALMLYAARKRYGKSQSFTVFGGIAMIIWVIVFALANIGAQILSQLHWIPTFTG